MEWLKKLQEKYKAGKLTKEQYDAKVKELLEDGDLDQAEHDEALEFDPKATGEKLIYSEEDMQRMAHNVARRTLRQELKKAGLELDVDNKGLVAAVVQLAKTGKESDGKGATATEQEIAQLRKDVAKLKPLEEKAKDLSLEVAVLKSAGRYQPHNAAQVVRALADYADLIEFDDESGLPVPKSVTAVISKLAKAEPNLFKTPNGEGGQDNLDDNQQGGGFNGKTPGGGAAGGAGATGEAAKQAELQAEALKRMGITPAK
jgi:hypothetical protein